MQTEALQHRLCSSVMRQYNDESLELLESGLNVPEDSAPKFMNELHMCEGVVLYPSTIIQQSQLQPLRANLNIAKVTELVLWYFYI